MEDIQANTNRVNTEKMEKLQHPSLQASTIYTFAEGIAHDFKNIFHVINGNINELLENATAENKEKLQDIFTAAEKGTEVVNQLLAFSGTSEGNDQTVDLNAKIIQFKNIFERIIPKTIAIDLALNKEVDFVSCDPVKLEGFFMSLFDSSMELMDANGKISISTDKCHDEDDFFSKLSDLNFAKITIVDSASDYTKEIAESINNPAIAAANSKGYRLVSTIKEMNGSMSCNYTENNGVEFTIYLPISEDIEIFNQPVEEKIPEEQLRTGGKTILIVDDDDSVNKLTASMLSKLGHTTIEADSGEKAIEIYRNNRDEIDLVLLDIGMPGMGGYECLKELVQINSDVMVVIASGYSSDKLIEATIASGAKAFIEKPYNKNELQKKINEILSS